MADKQPTKRRYIFKGIPKRKPHFKDIANCRFHKLLVLSAEPNNKHSQTQWRCLCDCGNIAIASGGDLRSGHTQSCGCYKKQRTSEVRTIHGHCGKTPEYKAWSKMKERCHNPADISFRNYGGRGIAVSPLWMNDYQSFLDHVGLKPEPKASYSLDRIDNGKGYEPGNVRWATRTQQNSNRRKPIH